MTTSHVVAALHFLQATYGPFEFERTIAGGIQVFRFGGSRCKQLHIVFVERIDQLGKPDGLVAVIGRHGGNSDNDHGMVGMCDGEIGSRPASFAA